MNNILYIVSSLNYGGAEKVCASLCNNINSSKYKIFIITFYDQVPLYDTIINNDVKIFSLGLSRSLKFPFISFKLFKKLFNTVKKIRPDILHSHLWGIHTVYLILFLFIRNKPKFITTIHSSEFIYTSLNLISRYEVFFEKIIYKIFDFELIAISEGVEEMIKKRLKFDKIHRIHNGVDTMLYSPLLKKKFENFRKSVYGNSYPIIIHVGRASEVKRQQDIIEALSLIITKFPNSRLLLVGHGNKEKYYSLASKHNVESKIDFIEVNNNIEIYLSISDIAVFPSLYEGLSLALAEMMSSELPIIVSNIPSLLAMTENGSAAMSVPIKNPAALAEKIIYLCENKIFSKKISLCARTIAEKRYSLKTMIENHEILYDSLLK